MANKYRATNILTGEVVEGTASDLADKLLTNETAIYSASSAKIMIDMKWKVVFVSKMLYKKQCNICGCEFETIIVNQQYCSSSCRSRAKYQDYVSEKSQGYKKRHKSLDELAVQASNARTSYGKYEAEKWAKENVKIVRKW